MWQIARFIQFPFLISLKVWIRHHNRIKRFKSHIYIYTIYLDRKREQKLVLPLGRKKSCTHLPYTGKSYSILSTVSWWPTFENSKYFSTVFCSDIFYVYIVIYAPLNFKLINSVDLIWEFFQQIYRFFKNKGINLIKIFLLCLLWHLNYRRNDSKNENQCRQTQHRWHQ